MLFIYSQIVLTPLVFVFKLRQRKHIKNRSTFHVVIIILTLLLIQSIRFKSWSGKTKLYVYTLVLLMIKKRLMRSFYITDTQPEQGPQLPDYC